MKKYIALIVVLAAFASGYKVAAMQYQLEISDMKLEAETAEKNAQAHARSKEQELQAITNKYNDLLANPKVVYKTITKEVIRYVQDDSIDKCLLHDDWVLLHDQAARPDLARSASGVDEADQAFTDAQALIVVAENYERCNEYQTKLNAWQSWWREIKNAH